MQRQMALDVKQAQEVEQAILPEERIVLPGLDIESEQRPALEVGGEFFPTSAVFNYGSPARKLAN